MYFVQKKKESTMAVSGLFDGRTATLDRAILEEGRGA